MLANLDPMVHPSLILVREMEVQCPRDPHEGPAPLGAKELPAPLKVEDAKVAHAYP